MKSKMKISPFWANSRRDCMLSINGKTQANWSYKCMSFNMLILVCHIHYNNPNITNTTQHWQNSSFKRKYQLCSFMYSKHHTLKNWTWTSWFNTRICKIEMKKRKTIMFQIQNYKTKVKKLTFATYVVM
jgi:hypothetical protein